MTIQQQFIVRYRASGHVRFQVPEQLTDVAAAEKTVAQIAGIEGVYSVRIFRRQRKLSIHYEESICGFKSLARQLFQILKDLDQKGCFRQMETVRFRQSVAGRLSSSVKNLKVSRWTGEKLSAAKETLQAAKVITKLGIKKPQALIQDPEKAVIDFLNDILVLYLIKLHWNRITQEWLPRPFAHRYEWLAVFYLFYLLIRSRRPKK